MYIEDNHAGTLQFLASTLDLNQPHALVLVDAHSDGTTPAQVAQIREGLRRVSTPEEREARIVAWRLAGRLQAYDWISPLMPRPIERVIWVAPLEPAKTGGAPRNSSEHPRSSATVAPWRVATLAEVEAKLPPRLPVVASIDLDYFAGLGIAESEQRFEKVWRRVTQLRRLSAISIAISRPWLRDEAEASHLLLLVLRAALSIANVDLRFEPFGIEGPDRSEKAKEFFRKGQEPPRFDPERTSLPLRSLLLANADRLRVRLDPARWEETLVRWRADGNTWRVVLDGLTPGSDRVVRPPPDSSPGLRLEGGPLGVIHHVTWLSWTPTRWSYNVLPDLPSGKTFVGTAPPVVDYASSVLAITSTASLDAETWRRALPGPGPSGVLRVSAELETDQGIEHTAVLEIRQGLSSGFREGLAEQFGVPYVFGAGFLRRGDLRGPDTGVGNDCANFLVSAWRRSGVRLPWCNPSQLRGRLVCLARNVRATDSLAIPKGAIDRGLVIHLGSHVAALWEDRAPVGVLDGNDLVAHHLGGAPEVVTLGELLARRLEPSFDLYVAPERKVVAWIAVGGDVMPGLQGDPPLRLRDALAAADLAVVNLETTVTSGGSAAPKSYNFAIPPERLATIRSLGVQAVSLANNHAGDFGPLGLAATIQALQSHQLAYFGGGPSPADAVRSWKTQVKGLTIAVLGVTLSDPDLLPAGDGAPGLAVLPRHEQDLAEAIADARQSSDCVIVIPHWGDEGKKSLNDEQRHWARWFVQHGADAVVGSGPHLIQSQEAVEGAPVFYSTGNLWFAGRWPEEARAAGIAFLGLDDRGRIVESRLDVIR